jgi:hypothetical protein
MFFCFVFFGNTQQIGLLTGAYLTNKEVISEYVAGLNLGFVVDSKQNKRFGFSGGLFYTQFQSSKKMIIYTPYSSKIKTNALRLPLQLKLNILNPEYKTKSDFWLSTGIIGASNLTRTRILTTETTGKKSKSSLEIENRYLIGFHSGIEISNLGENAAYAIGLNCDFYNNGYFTAIGLYFKISLFTSTDSSNI